MCPLTYTSFFCEAANYDTALLVLKTVYARIPNKIFARHALSTRKQQPDESLDEYLQVLKSINKDCNYRENAIRDTFIRGLLNSKI